MEFKIYTVPFSAYPRVQYAYKHLKLLLRRYEGLTNDVQLEKWDTTPIKTPFRDYMNKQTFQLCLQSLEGDRDIDIRSVIKQNDVPGCITVKCANVKELALKEYLQNSFSIIVTSDMNEDDIPEDKNVKLICLKSSDNTDGNQKATKGMQIVPKEQVYKTVMELMESNLYKAFGMKSRCECMLHILDAIFHVDNYQQKVSSLQRSKSEDNMICRTDESTNDPMLERSKSYMEKNHSERIQRGKLYTFVKKLLFKSKHKQKDAKGDILRQLPVTRDKGCLFDEDLPVIQKIERLSDEMLGMFIRSSIPENEKPQLGRLQDRYISAKLKKDLQKESSSIRSCGYRGCTLVIFVDRDCDPHNLKIRLKTLLLEEHNIVSFSVEPLNIKEFCKVGSKAEAIFGDGKTRRSGTLGGFGYAKSRSGNESKIIGLVSRHVFAIGESSATNALIHSEGKTTEASVDIDNSFADKIKPKDVLDIAAISFKEDTSEYDTTYRTSENKRAKGVLTTYTTEQMKGLPVQICGACTPLGRGTVTMSNIEGVRDSCMEENYIFVEDNITEGNENEVFCNESDSGAIVCTDDQDNPDKVQLISMVVGKYTGRGNIIKEDVYATLKLKKGIKQVEEETNSSIEFL